MSEMSLEEKLCKNLEDSCIKAYKAGQQSMQEQLNNMETCYIQMKKERDELQGRIDEALFEMQQLSLMLSKDIDGYEDPAQICQSEGVDMGVKILEKALRGASD